MRRLGDDFLQGLTARCSLHAHDQLFQRGVDLGRSLDCLVGRDGGRALCTAVDCRFLQNPANVLLFQVVSLRLQRCACGRGFFGGWAAQHYAALDLVQHVFQLKQRFLLSVAGLHKRRCVGRRVAHLFGHTVQRGLGFFGTLSGCSGSGAFTGLVGCSAVLLGLIPVGNQFLHRAADGRRVGRDFQTFRRGHAGLLILKRLAKHVVEIVEVRLPLRTLLFHLCFGLAQHGQRISVGGCFLGLQVSLALLQFGLGLGHGGFFLGLELQLQCTQHRLVLLAGQVRHLRARLDHLVGHGGVLHQETDVVVKPYCAHVACGLKLPGGVICHRRVNRSSRRCFALEQRTFFFLRSACGLYAFAAHGLFEHELFGRQRINALLLFGLLAHLGRAVELLAQLFDGRLQLFELRVDVRVERLVGLTERRFLGALLDLCLELSLLLLGGLVALLHVQRVLGCLFAGFFLRCQHLGFFVGYLALLAHTRLLGFLRLGLGRTALHIPADGGNSTTQHRTTNETVDVLFACFGVCDLQTCLQTLQQLLRRFSNTLTAHRCAGLCRIIRNGFAQCLGGNCFCLLVCQLGAHGAEQLAHTGQQRHGGSIQQGLWDRSANGFTEAGVL